MVDATDRAERLLEEGNTYSPDTGQNWPTHDTQDETLADRADRLMKSSDPYQLRPDQTSHSGVKPKTYYSEIGKLVRQTDKMGQGTLPGVGLDDYKVRAELSLAETPDEMKKVFMQKYPQGDFRIAKTSKGLIPIFRKDAKSPYDVVDPDPTLRKKGQGLDIGGDVMDMVGAIPEVAGEITGAVLSRGRTIPSVIGAMVGKGMEEAYEKYRGTQGQDYGDIFIDTLKEGGTALAGAAGAKVLGMGTNVARGSAITKSFEPERMELLRQAEEMGLDTLGVHQLTQNPIIKRMAAQSASVFNTLNNKSKGQSDSALKFLRNMRAKARSGQSRDDLVSELTEAEHRRLMEIVKPLQTGQSLTDAGTAVQKGITEGDDLLRGAVNEKYAAARASDDPNFNIQGAVDEADEIKSGVQAKFKGRLSTERTPTEHERGSIYHPTDKSTGAKGGNISSNPERDVRSVIDDLQKMDPDVGNFRGSPAIDQLKALRARLGDAMTPNAGEVERESHKVAKRLYAAIKRVEDNPANATDEFRALWGEANKAAKERFDLWDRETLRKLSKNDRPAEMAAALFSRKVGSDDLRVLRQIMPPERYAQFKSGAKQYYGDRPHQIESFLKDTDQETLDMLFSRSDQQTLRRVSSEFKTLESVGVQRAAQNQADKYAFVKELIDSRKTADIEQLYRLALSGKKGYALKDIRAALLDHVGTSALKRVKDGGEFLSPPVMRKTLQDLLDMGFKRFLTGDDVSKVKLLANYLEKAYVGSDAGTSLLAGQTVAQTQKSFLHAFTQPKQAAEAWLRLLELRTFGRVMAHPKTRDIFMGRNRKKPLPRLDALGAVLATTNKQYQQQDKVED